MQKNISVTKTILLASVAGGTAEVVWVLLFCLVSPLRASLVAEEIAQSFVPQIAGLSAVMAGLVIHYLLSVLIAGIAAMAFLRLLAGSTELPAILAVSGAALVAIWATNFFVVLPIVNPDFVTLMPHTVTLLSKLGFGITMGWVFGIRGVASTDHDGLTSHGRLVPR